jgi:hypothetical protein
MQSWKEGLGLLQPKNLRLLLLVTMKNTGDAYKLLLPYWVFMLIGKFLLYWILPYPLDPTVVPFMSGGSFSWMFGRFYDFIFLYIVCLACRPSLGRKTIRYFVDRMPDIIRVLIAQLFLGIIFLSCITLPIFLISRIVPSLSEIILKSAYFLTGNMLSPSLWIMINIFFLADANKIWQSVRNTMWFFVYNYPLILLTSIWCFGLLWLQYQLEAGIGSLVNYNSFILLLVSWIGYFIFWPFVVSLFANVYIKRAYEYADIYSA